MNYWKVMTVISVYIWVGSFSAMYLIVYLNPAAIQPDITCHYLLMETNEYKAALDSAQKLNKDTRNKLNHLLDETIKVGKANDQTACFFQAGKLFSSFGRVNIGLRDELK